MQCKNCSGQLVMRETRDYPIDENGVFTRHDKARAIGVYCLDCGARHAYATLHESGDQYTIALEANSDPEPIATVAIAFKGGILIGIGADQLVGLLVVDEDRQEIGRFLARPDKGEWKAMRKLEALIPKGENRASFAKEEESDE